MLPAKGACQAAGACLDAVARACSTPALEYRETNAIGADGGAAQEWAAGAMRYNGDAFSGARKPGGGVTFASPPGAVHTSFSLVDPALNLTHPEWFSERVTQLCWANALLVAYVTARVRELLAASPNAAVVRARLDGALLREAYARMPRPCRVVVSGPDGFNAACRSALLDLVDDADDVTILAA